jgi:predicted MFS family arabinose efflux permease
MSAKIWPLSTGTARAKSPPTGNGIALGGMLALAAGMGIGRFVYTPILPDMAAALGLSSAAAGLLASANFLGYLAGALLVALPHLGRGRRWWFLGGLAASAASTAAMAMTEAMPAFLLLRFIGGVASAFVLVLGSALVLDRLATLQTPSRAALHFAGVGVGIAVSALLVDALHAGDAGWQTLWWASGAVSSLTIPVVAWLVSETAPAAVPRSAGQRHPPLPRGLAALTLCHGLFGFGYVVTATFLVAVVRGTLHSAGLEAAVWLVVGLSAAPSTALWGWIGNRSGALRAYSFACLLEALGVAAGGIWPTAVGVSLAALLLGGTFMGITALGFAAARALGPHQQHRCFAIITAGFGLGQIIGPSVAGVLMDRTHGFAAPSLLAAGAVTMAAAITFWASYGKNPSRTAEPAGFAPG